MFEAVLLYVSQIATEIWEPIRRELKGIALIRLEGDLQLSGRPFLRFHPTLASAAADPTFAQNMEIRQRFLDAYLGVMQELDKTLRSSRSRAALEVLNREEANYRTTVRWAVADQKLSVAAALGHTFCNYLERSGRLRERDAWVYWLKDAVGQQGFTDEAADYERKHAWTRFTQGDPQGSIDQLRDLMNHLRSTTAFDSCYSLAATAGMLGRVLVHAGLSEEAIPVLREAVGLCELLMNEDESEARAKLLAPQGNGNMLQLSNLASAMSDLAYALSRSGQNKEALACAEKCIEILEKHGDSRDIAAGQGMRADIFVAEGRYFEAFACYDFALAAACQFGDKLLEGNILQKQAKLALDIHQLERANQLYRQALKNFQDVDNQIGVAQIYNSLGLLERRAGRLAEARVWHEKSREQAVKLKEHIVLGQTLHNLAIIWTEEGKFAQSIGNIIAAREHFQKALYSIEESLQIKSVRNDKPGAASSTSLLAQVHFCLGDFNAAELHAHRARDIREALSLKEVWWDYNTLAEIAQARGNLASAAEWAKKRDDLRVELKRRAGGGGGLPAQMLQALQRLTLACAQAGFGDGDFGSAEEEALTKLGEQSAPFPEFAAFLRQIAAGEVPPIPEGLPEELREWVEGLVEEIKARG